VPELAVFEQMHEFIFIEEKFLKILRNIVAPRFSPE